MKTLTLSVWLTPAGLAALREVRKAAGLSRSPAVEMALRFARLGELPERPRQPRNSCGSGRVTLQLSAAALDRAKALGRQARVSRSRIVEESLIAVSRQLAKNRFAS